MRRSAICRTAWINVLLLLPLLTCAQTANNNIAFRVQLALDSVPYPSTTENASVEWRCINKKLTEKCLVYHNDQWFYLIPPATGRYYLNITAQQCRDRRGVQVLVIEGNPCETTSYRLLHCTSFTDQNDTFIQLESLKKDVPYLINIDGFLGDFCSFEIQFATRPRGFPNNVPSLDTLHMQALATGQRVELTWRASEQLLDTVSMFEISRMRAGDKRATIHTVPSMLNALGRYREDYQLTDSVPSPGTYYYRIVGVSKDARTRIWLDDVRVEVKPPEIKRPTQTWILTFPVDFLFDGPVDVVITDARRDNVLTTQSLPNGQKQMISIDVSDFVNAGIRFFKIKAQHRASKNSSISTYRLTEAGEWIRMSR